MLRETEKKTCPALKYFFDVCEMGSLVLSVQLVREIWIKNLHLCPFQMMDVLFVTLKCGFLSQNEVNIIHIHIPACFCMKPE